MVEGNFRAEVIGHAAPRVQAGITTSSPARRSQRRAAVSRAAVQELVSSTFAIPNRFSVC